MGVSRISDLPVASEIRGIALLAVHALLTGVHPKIFTGEIGKNLIEYTVHGDRGFLFM